jgi:hypothetical protein
MNWKVIAGLAVVVLGGIAAYIWFRDPARKPMPLTPAAHVIQREIEAFKKAVETLDGQARQIAVSQARAVLADDYLSVREEAEIPARTMTEVEELKTRAPFRSVIDGFAFAGPGGEQKVPGFRFEPTSAAAILNAEFSQRATAVKERELLDRLGSLLRNVTQDDQWLDDNEMASTLRFITTPEPGKKAALSRAAAQASIVTFCRQGKIGTGRRPTAQ